ncbi:MAG: hypothetical protein JW996_07355 [Candidatus Cloacimonetes bacterium]|nr:hypothetical protein [Candidatus Cloacimonadota bacterium]
MTEMIKVLLNESDTKSVQTYYSFIRLEELNYRTEVSTSFESVRKKLPLLIKNAVRFRTIRKQTRNAEIKLREYRNRMEEIVEL